MKIKQSETLRTSLNNESIKAYRKGACSLCADATLLKLIKEEKSHAFHILTRLLKDWELYQVKIRLEREIAEISPKKSDDGDCQGEIDTLSRKIYESVMGLRSGLPEIINTGHLLYSIINDNSVIASRVLKLYGITRDQIEAQINELPSDEDYYDEVNALRDLEMIRSQQLKPSGYPSPDESGFGLTQITPDRTESMLEKYTTNLTQSAANGEIDCVIGRNDEIERLIQVLGRRKKNNPILVGESGVGKSAIVEGFALKIHNGDIPVSLSDKVLYSLDLAALIAGTKFRGEFETRLKDMIDELKKNKNAILFIDEIHTIVGAGGTQGNLDVANILKPALARGTIQCIGATTLDEYREYIESDTALEMRFQRILVEPTTPSQTLTILENIRGYYEQHHGVRYTDGALKSSVDLASRYINDRQFPDKAIDVLDEAGSRAHIHNSVEPQHIRQLEAEYLDAKRTIEDAVTDLHFNDAIELRAKMIALKDKSNASKAAWRREQALNPPVVDTVQIEEIITLMTGIPVDRVSKSEKERLMKLENHLENTIIGQKEAVDRIAKSIRRSRAGLKEANKPIGVFMFVGPTGVGKTLLAKELSKWLFDKDEALIRIDMSEYSEKHSVSRLIGSPPGYVGYGEGGQLTESVRRQPYSVVLFDEIEKAHPDMFNLMLQILDEGHITDGLGRKIDFKNTIIIMTSNVGSQAVVKRGNQVGYDTRGLQGMEAINRESIYRKSLENTFAPEFINRVDDIIVFNTLSIENVYEIVELEIAKLRARAQNIGFTIDFSDEVKAKLVNEGYEPKYGVRSLKRAILDLIEEPLADMIVCGELTGGDTVVVEDTMGEIALMKCAI